MAKTDDPHLTPQVLLLIESSRAYGRGCLMGIASYLRTHSPWHVLHLERGLQESVPDIVLAQHFDGVIARMETDAIADSIKQLGVPTVDLRGMIPPERGCSFDTDSAACASMAIEHFRTRGFQHVAYCGYPRIDFSDKRRDAFRAEAAKFQLDFRIFEPDQLVCDETVTDDATQPRVTVDTLQCEMAGELDEELIASWLTELPKPVAIFACNDMRGRQVLNAVRKTSFRVPDQIAVLGVDDDEVICDLATPPLSSIEPDTFRIGFEGAEMLDRLMQHESTGVESILVPPIRVATRQSTDILAVDDPDLAAAIQFIRVHACESIGVKDVLAATNISRATLERRFRDVLQRSPREEIERVKIERVRMLLTESTYSLDRISELSGYNTASHLVTAFRRLYDCTPGQFRSRIHANARVNS